MIERKREVESVEEDVEKVRSLEAGGCAARVQALDNGDSASSALQVLLVLSFESLGLLRATFNLNIQNVLERRKSSKHIGKKYEVENNTTPLAEYRDSSLCERLLDALYRVEGDECIVVRQRHDRDVGHLSVKLKVEHDFKFGGHEPCRTSRTAPQDHSRSVGLRADCTRGEFLKRSLQ